MEASGKVEMLEMYGQSVCQSPNVPSAHRNKSIVLQPGLINQANGSAYIENERTKIACAVLVIYRLPKETSNFIIFRYGPRQSKNVPYYEKGKLNVEVKFAPFSCHQRRAPLRVCILHR